MASVFICNYFCTYNMTLQVSDNQTCAIAESLLGIKISQQNDCDSNLQKKKKYKDEILMQWTEKYKKVCCIDNMVYNKKYKINLH